MTVKSSSLPHAPAEAPGQPLSEKVYGLVYRLVGQGWSDAEIAGHLILSEEAVQACIQRMMSLSHLEDRLDLIHKASSAPDAVHILGTPCQILLSQA